MNQTISLNKPRRPLFYTFVTLWSLLLLANFIPVNPQPKVIIGYLWKVEFAIAAFLFVALILFIKISKDKLAAFDRKEVFGIILPLFLFTAWSGFSCLWAESVREAVHHTLLWACYLIFFLLIRQVASKPSVLSASLKVTGIVLAILGIACVVEYTSNAAAINNDFTYRYYKYAEIAAALLPVFLAMSLRTRSATSVFFAFVAVISWFLVLLSLSRTVFIAGFAGVILFFLLAFLFSNLRKHWKKSILLLAAFVVCAFISQINFSPGKETVTVSRFGGSESSQASFNARFLFWGIALEAFKRSPILGVGADNFVTVYGTARESYSAQAQENKLLEINETILAERAHNEYLQILSELGVVGIVIFGWLLAGIALLALSIRKKRVPLLEIAAFAGIFAFLLSSAASSYSFRVPANGLCFFFLLALAVKSLKSKVSSPKSGKRFDFRLGTWDLRPVFGLMICAVMLIFSTVRGASLMYLELAMQNFSEPETAEPYFQEAMRLDDREGSFKYYYGLFLYSQKRTDEAIPQIASGIDGGIATSVSFFYLASAQNLSKQTAEAEKTFREALKVYPRSTFLLTAYAAFLNENGKEAEAEIEYEKAFAINPKQAKSWRIAHAEGMKKLTEAESTDKDLVKVMDLAPEDAIYALLDFQRQFNPNLVRR